MGNHGSRKEGRRSRSQSSSNESSGNTSACGGQAVHALKRVEELRGPPTDSYDKLIAWLSEMAESDNVPLDTSVFVKQLNSVCGGSGGGSSNRSASNGFNNLAGGGSERGGELGFGRPGMSAGARRLHTTVRQHSASCDSRPVTDALPRGYNFGRSAFSRSMDDTLDPRLAWRQNAFISLRQGTCSDDLQEDPDDLRNASMESLYSGSDRDSEVEAMASTYTSEPIATRRARFSQQREQQSDTRRPLLRQALLGNSTCSSHTEGDSGKGDAAAYNSYHSQSQHGRGSVSASGRYSGYGSCSNRSSMVTISSTLMPVSQLIPCSASTGDLDKLNTALEEVTGEHDTPERLLARRRSVSLLNLTPPGRASYYVPDAAEPPDTPPTRAPPPTEMFLDDTLLDGNMADILFSVEALWPKK